MAHIDHDSQQATDTELDPNACAACGAPPESGGYKMPLCASCRDKFANRPFPPFIRASGLIVLIMVVISLPRFFAPLNVAIDYERGHKAESAGNYTLASSYYLKVVARYPDSLEPLARLAICQIKSEDRDGAYQSLRKLENREMPEDLYQELDSLVKERKP